METDNSKKSTRMSRDSNMNDDGLSMEEKHEALTDRIDEVRGLNNQSMLKNIKFSHD